MVRTLEDQFHDAMISIYKRAKSECNYNATRFLQMVNDLGGLRAAKSLLHARGLSEGFTALWEFNRLDLTMEALILKQLWKDPFSKEELGVARKRLSSLGYTSEESK